MFIAKHDGAEWFVETPGAVRARIVQNVWLQVRLISRADLAPPVALKPLDTDAKHSCQRVDSSAGSSGGVAERPLVSGTVSGRKDAFTASRGLQSPCAVRNQSKNT